MEAFFFRNDDTLNIRWLIPDHLIGYKQKANESIQKVKESFVHMPNKTNNSSINLVVLMESCL